MCVTVSGTCVRIFPFVCEQEREKNEYVSKMCEKVVFLTELVEEHTNNEDHAMCGEHRLQALEIRELLFAVQNAIMQRKYLLEAERAIVEAESHCWRQRDKSGISGAHILLSKNGSRGTQIVESDAQKKIIQDQKSLCVPFVQAHVVLQHTLNLLLKENWASRYTERDLLEILHVTIASVFS